MAEIIVPGQSFPTFDRASSPGKTFDQICDLRRRTLDAAARVPALKTTIDNVLGADYAVRSKTMDCAAMRGLFRSIAVVQRANNNAVVRTVDTSLGSPAGLGGPKDLGTLQKSYDDFWAARQ